MKQRTVSRKEKIVHPHSACQTYTSGQFGLGNAFRELAGVLQSIYLTGHKEWLGTNAQSCKKLNHGVQRNLGHQLQPRARNWR